MPEVRERFVSASGKAGAPAIFMAPDDLDLWRHFSLVEGGPLYRLARTAGLTGGAAGLIRIGLALSFFTWLPLGALTLIPHTPPAGPALPFILSFGTHARLLLAIPLFFLAEAIFDARIRQVLRSIVDVGVVPEHQRSRLNGVLRQVITLRDAWHVEAVLLVLTLVLILWGVRTDLSIAIPSWRTSVGGDRTPAGWWYGLVAIPVFQFLFWRWCARLVVWWYLLWHVGHLELRLIPTHPDLAGGLGGLGVAHVALAPVGVSMSALLVGTLAEQVLYAGARVQDYTMTLVGLIAAITFILIAPLLRFSLLLLEVRQHGLLEYGALATRYVRAFDDKWLRQGRPPDEPLLGSADVQSLADLSNSFEVISRMRYLPMSLSQFLALVGLTALPTLPLVLFVVSFQELVLRGLRVVFLG